ncbi:MAG: 50S ribosomal protein L17 [Candidatus Obscuribacterales bacterium]|jgi:large subunit ribosomal protein L17|nr:50S ribosomal protein L17 [Candidatus Obscuribacterales bacterium]
MRHRVPGNRLSRPYDQHRALLRALATELLRHDEIVTTVAKAKAVRSQAEKMITLAKRGLVTDTSAYAKSKSGDSEAAKVIANHVHCRRQMQAYLYDKEVVDRAFTELAPRYAKRNGGYTRIVKTHFRRGDAAPMALIQLV